MAEARWNPGSFPDNYRLTDVDLAVHELERLTAAGCRTVVDATPVGLGRDPLALQRIAQRTGLNVVMGCGWYVEAAHPPGLAARTVEDMSRELIREIETGVGGTGIRPGLIGEIGTSASLKDAERRVLVAAARAQCETGLALSIHLHPWSFEGMAVLDLLEREGVDPCRVLLNHLTTAVADDGYQRALLDRGARLCYDLFGFDHSCIVPGRYPPSDYDAVAKVAELASEGYLRQLFVSQDIGVKTRLCAYGGWGYAHLFEHVVPLLRTAGMDECAIDRLLIDNPARMLVPSN